MTDPTDEEVQGALKWADSNAPSSGAGGCYAPVKVRNLAQALRSCQSKLEASERKFEDLFKSGPMTQMRMRVEAAESKLKESEAKLAGASEAMVRAGVAEHKIKTKLNNALRQLCKNLIAGKALDELYTKACWDRDEAIGNLAMAKLERDDLRRQLEAQEKP